MSIRQKSKGGHMVIRNKVDGSSSSLTLSQAVLA